jgi:hypothetical protein
LLVMAGLVEPVVLAARVPVAMAELVVRPPVVMAVLSRSSATAA